MPTEQERFSDWRPTASWPTLRRRAELMGRIRDFFRQRNVLEVETPLLAAATVPDVHLASLQTTPDIGGRRLYLQTSPEYAMKRLLAAGSGPIYQITKAFRDGERGRLHNVEFTLLEWYRPGYTHHQLMDEMDELLAAVLDLPAARRVTYGELFAEELGLDPHTAPLDQLLAALERSGLASVPELAHRDEALDLLMSRVLEPRLGHGATFVYDYPTSQAALARLRPGPPPVAERFEVYVQGVELANGFHELTDAGEQRRRFEADLDRRRALGLEAVELDERFLAALEHGLEPCSGVAVGVDRLVLLATGTRQIEDVLAFPIDRA